MQLKRFTDELDSAEVVLRSLALMIEARDAYTEGHCERLARYAAELGEHLGLPETTTSLALGRGGYFHDIGKIAHAGCDPAEDPARSRPRSAR